MPESFAGYISMLRRQFVQYCSEALLTMDVTYSQLFVIIFIGKRATCSPKEISQALHLDPGQLNRMLTKLLEQGIVAQKKKETDKRANIVSLTEKGQNIFQRSRELFGEWDRQVLSSLSAQEQALLLDLMKKILFPQIP